MSTPRGQWVRTAYGQELHGKAGYLLLLPRPAYCDRGRFYAQAHFAGLSAPHIDEADGFPRYYFDEERAKLELEAWMKARGQL
jgi:hypothetical protein